jgi:hypothetical protein
MHTVRKYEPIKLVKMFRLVAALRNEMLKEGFTDNGGAIHSAERILNILGPLLCYPGLTHINNLRNLPNAPFSEKPLIAHRTGEKVLIEHVAPHRALTRLAIDKIDADMNDDDFILFIKANFQLALLTVAETAHLNKINRSSLDPNRLKNAGINIVPE